MASNFNRRSNSLGSKKNSRADKTSALPSSVKGRPSQDRSVRMPQNNRAGAKKQTAARPPQRRVSHSAYRDANVSLPSNRARNTRPAPVSSHANSRRTSSYGSSLPNVDSSYLAGQGSRAQGRGSARQTYSNEPLRSVSVSQVRSNRRQTQQKRSHKGLIIGIVVVIIVAVMAVGLFILSRTDLFPVNKITVSGVHHLTDQETAQLAAVPEGTTLLNVDAGGIEGRLESNPWVLDASVERHFPDTLNLNITERDIVAVVDVVIDDNDNQQTWALASDGTWLMQIPDRNSEEGQQLAPQVYEDVDAALHISSVPYGAVPEAGSQCNNPNISNALAIIDGMSTELADQVKSVSAASSDSTALTLNNGVEIAFGDSSDIRDKERVCLELMREHPGKIAYINVRTVNKPIWRAV